MVTKLIRMEDHIKTSVKEGRIVFWEEIARDGAQSKTILSGEKRAYFANKNASLFNGEAHKHLIFASGFPTAGKNEFNAIKTLAEQVDTCYLATHGRPTRNDMDTSIEAIKAAKYPRLSFLIPSTQEKAQTIMKCDLEEAFQTGIDLVKYTKDKQPDFPLDIAIVDSPGADTSRLAEFLNEASENGVSISKLCDSRGLFYPNELSRFYKNLASKLTSKVDLGVHFHNDLSMALWNSILMLQQGIRMVSTSWLGLAERSGLVSSEQILFVLFHETNLLNERLGISNPENLISGDFNLKMIVGLAKEIAEELNIPIKTIDPIIGSGLNSISTGLPFTNPKQFQPFDPKEVLGVEQEVVVTHMASKKVISHVAKQLGFEFNYDELSRILDIIKSKPYDSRNPVFKNNELSIIFNSIKNKKVGESF